MRSLGHSIVLIGQVLGLGYENWDKYDFKALVKSYILSIWDTRKNNLYDNRAGAFSGCSCSCPLTGDLTSSACICGCVVNGSNMSIIIILIQGYFAVFLSGVCVCVCVILCTELKWSVTDLLSLPPSLLSFSPLGCLTMARVLLS